MSGWISLHRKLSLNPLWLAEPMTRGQAWVDLLLLANHSEGHIRVRGVRVVVARGVCGYSEVALATRWKWSRGKVRRFLKELESVQQIVQQKTNATSLIAIINYDEYQTGSTANSTPSSTPSSTANSTASSTRTIRNNNKNNENKEGDSPPLDLLGQVAEAARPRETIAAKFAKFWSAYPRKIDKGNAERAFKKALKAEDGGMDAIMQGLARSPRLNRPAEEKEFVPYAATWLNGKGWHDEPEATTQANAGVYD